MKIRFFVLLAAVMLIQTAPVLADQAPAAAALGSEAAAGHLATHIYAYTDGWDGYGPVTCTDEGCEEYGHVHCYGRRVSVWDTPRKGDQTVAYYPGTLLTRIGPDTEFQLVDVVSYKGKFYANVRILDENGSVTASGFVNADYIGCDCESYDAVEEVPVYDSSFGPFDLR